MIESLESLLRRCRAREDSAITALVKRFRPWALDLAAALVGDEALGEDVVQEAFLTALERLPELRQPDAFPGWFRQIVRTHANRIARKRREVLLAAPVELPSEGCSPRGRLERKELRRTVREALRALPPAGRETAQLFYLEERSCAEIAHMLQVPKGTIRRRLHDVRSRLRNMLLGYVGGEAPESEERKKPERGLPL